ncbi:helix-turn-helix domain-containing protein [Microbacterium sp. NPDC077663]|uniref:helix-turn-helix domain-containing protein n=1 Tax=Microbacterium sp. NPDC077663 TaxID=3364189 RepID=UPI0037C6ACA8
MNSPRWDTYPPVMTPAEVGEALGMRAATVRARLRAGTMPARQLGRTWIILKHEVIGWAAAVAGEPEPAEARADPLAGYPDLLTYRDLMRFFRIDFKGTVYIWLEQGAIPATNIGSRWVVHTWRLRQHLEESNVLRDAPLE